jgi:hypothetical protein
MLPETNAIDTGAERQYHPLCYNFKAKTVVTSAILYRKLSCRLMDHIRTVLSLVIVDTWPDFRGKNLEMKHGIVLRW